ncbi:hypothetical protein AAZX31_09G080900 [Glycine max]|uniref:Uncharacterized protein n=3 Tax=Glycine subgen. Soja TaxID=1462606 RepID=I1L232_SOYBN|nr:hypothetical protein JHK87_024391 [Glycine soja]KAG5006468.1 hypothetical protein JHK85_025010 [Glycine max]KAG5012255.1 hypothetical protein JHK86_024516 [Glycine max]KAG5133232.1 hypothetical protein JHK82_024420 [Glycine max]KAH1042133.1 hypothetical protein GYH30_024441 [Glycine max]
MADSTIKVFGIVFFLVLISQGYSQCFVSDISVRQSKTGVIVEGKQEWSVIITNKCPCPQKNVILNCKGFNSIERINPSLLTVSSDLCLLNAGQPIYKNVIKFKYVWDHQFPLNPISSVIFCS